MIYITTIILFALVFYIWMFSPLETSDRVGITTAISMVALFIVTSIYAWHTRKMAEEMREQRLSEASPHLVLRLRAEKDVLFKWPSDFPVVVLNAGKGPAVNLYAALWHRHNTYFISERKGFLAHNEKWEITISHSNAGIEEKEGWLPKLKDLISQDYPGAIAVEYQDIHERKWASYLCLERHIDVPDYVGEGEQHTVELGND